MDVLTRSFWGAVLFLLPFVSGAAQVSDDFSDDSDNGWARYAPLDGRGLGGEGTWSLSEGTYRLRANPATTPASTGPARIGSIQTNLLAEFDLAADFVAWDNSLDQLFGLFARVNTPGFLTTSGYAFAYGTRAGRGTPGRFELFRVTAETGTTLVFANYTLEAGRSYRFVLSGKLSQLHAEVFDLAEPTDPIVTLNTTDSTYVSGSSGVFGYDNSPAANHAVDFTVDNFLATAPRPPMTLSMTEQNGVVTITWPAWATSYGLQVTTDLGHPIWTPVTWNISQVGTNYVFTDLTLDQQFFRLVSP